MLDTPVYMRRAISVNFSPYTAEWNVTGKSAVASSNVAAYVTYGTQRASAYRILEDTLNLRDVRIYDTVQDADGKSAVCSTKGNHAGAAKQQAIKDAFGEWVWKDAVRRQTLVSQYNEQFNAIRPREYDGQHITFVGMNPEISCGSISETPWRTFSMAAIRCLHIRWAQARPLRWSPLRWRASDWGCAKKHVRRAKPFNRTVGF